MIRFVFRWAFRAVLLAIVLVVALFLAKDNLARSWAEREIRRATGFDTKVGKLQLALFEPRINIENLVLYNPPEFGGSPLFDAADLQLDYEPAELLRRKVHLKFVRLRLKELNIVQANGRTNITDLLHKVSGSSDRATGQGAARGPHYSFGGVDLLNLSIGRIRYLEPARPKRNQEINLSLENHMVRDLRSEDDFANVLLKLVFRAGITIFVDEHPHPRRPREQK